MRLATSGRADRLDSICRRLSGGPSVSEFTAGVWCEGLGVDFHWSTPGASHTHLIASSTKLVAAVMVGQLVDQGHVSFPDPLADYLPTEDLTGLNSHGGKDWALEITVGDVLAHTSGIPDYHEKKRLPRQGDTSQLSAADPGWNYEDTLEIARGMDASFAPDPHRAHYSGTNYQSVGRLIEVLTGISFAECVRDMIARPLGLSDTEVLSREGDTLFASASPLFLGKDSYLGAQRMASLGAEGAIVSSVSDMLAFLRAWVSGKIVSAPLRAEMMMRFNPVFPGIGYGAGVMELTLPQNSALSRRRALYGHSGVTGHVMFHDPKLDAMIVLTTNQLTPSLVPYKALAQIIGVLDS